MGHRNQRGQVLIESIVVIFFFFSLFIFVNGLIHRSEQHDKKSRYFRKVQNEVYQKNR